MTLLVDIYMPQRPEQDEKVRVTIPSYIITQYIQKWDFKNPYHVDVNFYSPLICYACGVETERLRDDK